MYWQWMIQIWNMFVPLSKILPSSIKPVEMSHLHQRGLFGNTKML